MKNYLAKFYRVCYRIFYLTAVSLLVTATSHAYESMTGYVQYSANSLQDRCVVNVESSFNRIRNRSDIMGVHKGVYSHNGGHWQGVARLQNGNNQYVAISHSTSGTTGGFVIVQMASRNTDGVRYRSNRFSYYSKFKDTVPVSTDRAIKHVLPISQATGNRYDHIGGIQVYGDTLLLPAENRINSANTSINTEILFYDVSNPTNPVIRPYSVASSHDSAGNVAIIRLQNGKYLLGVGRDTGIQFYVSTTTSLADPNTSFTPYYHWRFSVDGLGSGSIDYNWPDSQSTTYQAITFLMGCNGSIYVAGTHNDVAIPGWGEDWADLYRITNGSGNALILTKRAKKHVWCEELSAQQCDLLAAAGLYVDTQGELILYSTEHGLDGPSGSIKMAEFAAERTSCPTINDAWVELFDDDTFGDRHLLIDYVDRNLKPYVNYTYDAMESFNDKASSVRWCIPSGYAMKVYQNDSYGGSALTLSGTGTLQTYSNLKNQSFGDKISSSKFVNQ